MSRAFPNDKHFTRLRKLRFADLVQLVANKLGTIVGGRAGALVEEIVPQTNYTAHAGSLSSTYGLEALPLANFLISKVRHDLGCAADHNGETMMSVVVRRAIAGDVGLLAALNEVVQKLHVDAECGHFRAVTDRVEVEAFFANLMRAPKTLIFIAELSRRAVGYIWSELQERPATPFTHAHKRVYIHHVAVKAEARGSGVGTALLQASEQEARALGVSEAALDTWAFNVGAQRFFEASDFTPVNIVMRKRLAQSA
jgi:diamine N-acetyltransferase